jgi:lipopolysaccharide/colanic/teichoic acid biosynthesis glycosyltransferase
VTTLNGALVTGYGRDTSPPGRRFLLGVAVVLLVILLAAAAAVRGPIAIALAAGLVFIALTFVAPALAAYALLGLGPLLTGLDRGQVLPLLRPNEALLLLAAAGIGGRTIWLRSTGAAGVRRAGQRRWSVELALVAMAGAASLLPLLWLAARHQPFSQDDVLYTAALWKYMLLYIVVRTAIRTPQQVRRCLLVILGVGAFVGALAILQSTGIAGVPKALARIYDPASQSDVASSGRGSSTLGSSIAVGDVCAYTAAVAVAWLVIGERRWYIGAAALMCIAGALGSGQFSGALALVIAVTAAAVLLGRTRQIVRRLLPAFVLAAVALSPVIAQRLAGFTGGRLPASWSNRIHNLQTYFWPRLGEQLGWLLGVQPSSRIADPHRAAGYVWIESGYTWLLWTGGLPLLIAFLAFVVVGIRATKCAARSGAAPPIRIAAVASYGAFWVVTILMLFDPHVSLRGSADLFFPLLALGLVDSRSRSATTLGAGAGNLAPRRRQRGFGLGVKRLIDVVASAALLVVLSPLLLLVAIAIRLDSNGPILYRGSRLGRDAAPIVALKFRSMHSGGSDALHATRLREEMLGLALAEDSFKVPDDPRITRVGRVIRRLSLDELPQLINVLAGDMSLVGPRPEVPYAVDAYSSHDWQRFTVLPGITGLWQTSGRSLLAQPEMLSLDVQYADRWSIWLDIRLLLATPGALKRGDGAR